MYDNFFLSQWAEILLVIIAVLGVIFNVVVIKIIFFPRVRTPLEADSILMVLIALFDVIACGFALISQSLRWGNILNFHEPYSWCQFDLLFFSTSTYATLGLTSALSLVRYLVIVRGWDITWKSSLNIGAGLILMVWSVVLFRGYDNPPLLMPSGLYCMPLASKSNAIKSRVILNILSNVIFLPFPFIIIICYSLVTFHYHRLVKDGSRAVLQQSEGLVFSPSMLNLAIAQFTRAHRRNSIKLIAVIIAYILSISPEYIFSFLSFAINLERSPIQDSICFLCMFSISLINPMFVLNLHHSSSCEFNGLMHRFLP